MRRAFLRDVRATAEHTLMLMLALLRRAHAAITHVHNGGWNRDLFRGHELHQKTVGVVGYGRLGRIVARYVHAFDARVLAADPHVTSHDVAPEVTLVPLEALLPAADIVTLHVNLDPATVGFFGRAQFAAMKRGAWFINTSRGELVDEVALLEALQQGHLAGAALGRAGRRKGHGHGRTSPGGLCPLAPEPDYYPPHRWGHRGINGQNRMCARQASNRTSQMLGSLWR